MPVVPPARVRVRVPVPVPVPMPVHVGVRVLVRVRVGVFEPEHVCRHVCVQVQVRVPACMLVPACLCLFACLPVRASACANPCTDACASANVHSACSCVRFELEAAVARVQASREDRANDAEYHMLETKQRIWEQHFKPGVGDIRMHVSARRLS